MAQLFIEDGVEWLVAPLDGNAFTLGDDAKFALRPQRVESGENSSGPVLERTCGDSGEETWAVLDSAGSALRINGTPIPSGIRVLSHRDELRMTGVAGRAFFSLERFACVEPFAGIEDSRCPRCQQSIELETSAVCCPQCSVWHHESEDFGCWTYAETCALCDQPTEFEAGFRWTPDEVSDG